MFKFICRFIFMALRLFIFIVPLLALSSCQFFEGSAPFFKNSNVTTDIKDPQNQYNAETTYQKLIAQYPFIEIASSIPPDSVTAQKNITYVAYGQRHLQLDLYSPKNIKPFNQHQSLPAIIFIHGGGWKFGYRTNFTPFAIAMAARGYVAATISYRLSGEAKFPAAIYDAKNAIRFLREHAKQFHINPNQIAIAGGSAGGQIAALTGVTNDDPWFDSAAYNKKISSHVQAIINIDGLSDFTSEAAREFEDDPRKNPSAAGAWLGGRYSEATDNWRKASPIYYASAQTPPILFLISTEKRFSLGHLEMIEKLSVFGVTTQVVKIPNTPHSFWLFNPWLAPSVEAADNFLKKIFKS